jgi:proteic killer suppression protein
MIRGFAHRGLRQLFEDDNAKGVNAEHVRKINQILAVLHAAGTIEALRLPTFKAARVERRPQGPLGGRRSRELAHHLPV